MQELSFRDSSPLLRPFFQLSAVPGTEVREGPLVQSPADLRHQVVVEIQIVEHRQPQGQHLVSLEQVPQVGPGVIPAHRAVATLTDRPVIGLVLLVQDVDGPLPGEQLAVAAVAGGHDAVEEVHARLTASIMLLGVPTPMRYRGFSGGM